MSFWIYVCNKYNVKYMFFFAESIISVSPFLSRLETEDQKDEFMDDYIQTYVDRNLVVPSPDPNVMWHTTPYKQIVIYAKK